MKKTLFIVVILAVFHTTVLAQEVAQNVAQRDTIYIKSPRFASLLIEKWIADYKSINSDVEFKQTDKNHPLADIEFVTGENHAGQIITVGKYALLAVTSTGNPLIAQISKERLNKKDLRKIFFIEDSDEPVKPYKYHEQITVYSGNSSVSTETFAGFFGQEASGIRGKKISGDDIFLLNAIQRDNTGVTFNNLSYLYDINTRKLKDNIALLPLDLKKEFSEALLSANIDELINILENRNVDLIPVQDIGFVANIDNKTDIKDFIAWVLDEGQKYNHTYGFLQSDGKTLAQQVANK
jgi:ABC-type phosphate transport system substrate-binding protein